MTASDGRLDHAQLSAARRSTIDAPHVLQVERIRSWEGLDALREEWDALLASSDSASVFLGIPFIAAWRDEFGRAYSPVVLACRSDAGRLRGIAPLLFLPSNPLLRVMRFIGDIRGESTNLDIIAERGFERPVAEAVLAELDRMRDAWDVLDLGQIPEESPVLPHLRAGAVTRRWMVEERTSSHLIIDLAAGWDAILSRLSKKARWAATYSDRHLARAGVLVGRHCTRPDELPYFLDALFALNSERWSLRGERGSLFDPARRAYFRRLAARFLEGGVLDFDLLELDGRPIAAQLGCRHANTYYLLDGGFGSAYAGYSPGVVLTGRVIRRIIADGIARYDFLQGDEGHKHRWSPRVSRYIRLRVARRQSRGGRYLTLARVRSRWSGALRNRFPALWRLTRRALARTKES